MQQKWNQNFDGEPMTDIPQKFLNAGCDVYMVMQLRHDEKILDERFASMRELHRRGKTPDPEHYEVTYYPRSTMKKKPGCFLKCNPEQTSESLRPQQRCGTV